MIFFLSVALPLNPQFGLHLFHPFYRSFNWRKMLLLDVNALQWFKFCDCRLCSTSNYSLLYGGMITFQIHGRTDAYFKCYVQSS